MASIFWEMDITDSMGSAHETEAIKQFYRESTTIINKINLELEEGNLKYSIDDKSKQKALWMLCIDAFDTINDCLILLKNSNHRITGKLIRDIAETLNLVEYFNSGTDKANNDIIKWFNDKIIENKKYREYIKKRDGEEKSEYKKEYYRSISKITHHTYKSLLYAYSLGSENRIVYERVLNKRILVIAESIAMYCNLLADLIYYSTSLLISCKIIPKDKIDNIWNSSIENYRIPRKYEIKTNI